jgi:peptidyl-prolyl cis-trans isomerase C
MMKRLSLDKRYSVLLLLSVLLIFFMSSCSEDTLPEDSEIVATVNGEEITITGLREFIGYDNLENITNEEEREALEDLIRLTILAQESENSLVTENPEIRERIKLAEKRIKANALLAKIIHDIDLTENEMFNYYQIHKSRYEGEVTEYRIQRILLSGTNMADSVSTMINSGEITFAEAARRYSQERTRETDGFAGYQTPEEMGAIIWNVISNLNQWRFSRVSVSNGIYLIRYTDTRERTIERPFTEVIEEVRDEMLQERKNDEIVRFMEELIGRSEIIISR